MLLLLLLLLFLVAAAAATSAVLVAAVAAAQPSVAWKPQNVNLCVLDILRQFGVRSACPIIW